MARFGQGERLLLASALSLALHAGIVIGYLPRPGAGEVASPTRDVNVGRVAIRIIEPQIAQAPVNHTETGPTRTAAIPAKPEPDAIAPSLGAQSVEAMPEMTAVAIEPPAEPRHARGTVYIPSSEVDVRASPLDEIVLEFPPQAGFATGYLVLQIFINELGTVDSINVMVSDPEGLFDAAAVRAFAGARFQPAVKAGVTVKTEMIVEVKYEPPILPAFMTTIPGLPPPAQ